MQPYPKPLHPHKWSSERRPLLPIQPHPKATANNSLPELPSPPRRSLIDEWYSLSTHIIPAAFPRSTPDVDHPFGVDVPPSETREAKAKRITKLMHEYNDLKVKHWGGKLPGHSEKKLWCCIGRYVLRRHSDVDDRRGKKIRRKKLTLFLVHANGFMKEIWEPSLKYLVSTSVQREETLFDEIWTWEAVNHGDSALLNSSNLGAIYDWADNTRDILNFLFNYMPESAGEDLPVQLPRVSAHISKNRELDGFTGRILVSAGHSFGGNTTALAAIKYPALFSSLILIEPMISIPPLNSAWITEANTNKYMLALIEGALHRRNRWSSKAEAVKLLKKHPFFSAWDPAVFDIYVECALHLDPDGGVKLKMSGNLEAVSFADRRATFEVWDQLPELDEMVELRFIIPENTVLRLASSVQELVWLRPANASNIRITSLGHLVPHEKPEELAREIGVFVQCRHGCAGFNPRL